MRNPYYIRTISHGQARHSETPHSRTALAPLSPLSMAFDSTSFKCHVSDSVLEHILHAVKGTRH